MIRCKHCNGEHPDDYKFCPVTGKELEQPLKACSNPDCDNFEKSILPVEARFCPKCGYALAGTSIKKKDIDMFFPIKEIYPDSKLSDVLKNASLYDEIEICGCNRVEVCFDEGCAGFRDDRLESMAFHNDDKMPLRLSKLGFRWDLSFDEWIRLLKQLKFTIFRVREPHNAILSDGEYRWESLYVAKSSDESLKIELVCDDGIEVEPSAFKIVRVMILILPCYVGPFGDTYQNYELHYSHGHPIKVL